MQITELGTRQRAGFGTRGHVKKRRWGFAAALVGIFLFWFAANAGRILVVDAPEKSDVILVLAGETDERPTTGLRLLSQGYGQQVVIDVPAATKIYEFTQVELAEKYVRDLPQGAAVRVCPIEGLSTRDEAHNAERCLMGESGDRILIVTSDFHTRRALSTFRHEIHGKTFSIAGAPSGAEFGARWWTHREWAKTCFYEWLRLVWWNAVDRWR